MDKYQKRRPCKRRRGSCIQEKSIEHLLSTTHSATDTKGNKTFLQSMDSLRIKGLWKVVKSS